MIKVINPKFSNPDNTALVAEVEGRGEILFVESQEHFKEICDNYEVQPYEDNPLSEIVLLENDPKVQRWIRNAILGDTKAIEALRKKEAEIDRVRKRLKKVEE